MVNALSSDQLQSLDASVTIGGICAHLQHEAALAAGGDGAVRTDRDLAQIHGDSSEDLSGGSATIVLLRKMTWGCPASKCSFREV